MTVYLVRHAKAGSRSEWDNDDALRPLSAKGRTQAAELAERLAPRQPTALLSSPSVRCRQTLEPLAERLGLTIHNDQALREGAPLDHVLELLLGLPDGAVCSSHGDVIPDAVDALVRKGMQLEGEPAWGKASVWLLEPGDDGYTSASAWPPP